MIRISSLSTIKSRLNVFRAMRSELQQVTINVFLIFIAFIQYLNRIGAKFIIYSAINKDLIEITTSRFWLLNLLFLLRKHTLFSFNTLIDYTAIDYPGKHLRFELVVFLLSNSYNVRIKIRFFTNDLYSIHTLAGLYPITFWLEREIWDMFGLVFENNGDLRRILTDYGFLGHPLRKDFPLTGYSEIFFDDFKRTIVSAQVSLAQEYRYYILQNPWKRP